MVVALTGWVDAGGAGDGRDDRAGRAARRRGRVRRRSTSPMLARPAADPADRAVRRRRRAGHRLAAIASSRSSSVARRRGPRRRRRPRAGAVAALADGRVEQSSTRPAGSACARPRRSAACPRWSRTARPPSGARDGDAALARAGDRRRCGPTTRGRPALQTVVQRALGDAGIPASGLWAQVPQYVAGSPSPPAVRALLARLVELYHLDLDLRALDARSQAYLEPGRGGPRGASRREGGRRPDRPAPGGHDRRPRRRDRAVPTFPVRRRSTRR